MPITKDPQVIKEKPTQIGLVDGDVRIWQARTDVCASTKRRGSPIPHSPVNGRTLRMLYICNRLRFAQRSSLIRRRLFSWSTMQPAESKRLGSWEDRT